MMKLIVLFSCLVLHTLVFAQQKIVIIDTNKIEKEESSTFKMSGYIQTQFQYGDKEAILKVGTPNFDNSSDFNRIGIRRGRIKLQYEKGIGLGVFQIDITEKGVGLRDAYLKIKDPWFGSSSIKLGFFNRPFGYEIAYSSSRRESPERAIINQTLFPDERDLGIMATFQAKNTSSWSFLKLEIGMIAGNGVKIDTDNRKDLISHLSFKKQFKSNVTLGGGVSYYYGGVYQGTKNVFSMSDKTFVVDSTISNRGKFAKREYFGFDAQFSIVTKIGKTHLYGEYIFGTQAGNELSSQSPNYASLPSADIYLRNFRGGYLTFVQDFGKSPFSLVAKAEWYDPNTQLDKNDIGFGGTGKADVSYLTNGFGLLWRINDNIRLQAYYEFVTNERTQNSIESSSDLKDNIFTLRMQFKF
jgi:phosphate-selective porin